MTRIEEIDKAAMEYASPMTEEDELLKYEAFKSGAKWADTYSIHYDGQGMLHVLQKGVEQGKKEMLDKMREWLNKNLLTSDITVEHHIVFENFIKCFEEAMEDK